MTDHLYYHDSDLRQFQSRVAAIASGDALSLALERSAFYPTSGGQPADCGELRGAGGARAAVLDVEEDADGVIWHRLDRVPDGGFAVGDEVEGEINWSRRFDHMQQHSGQHLLSAVLLRECGARTLSFHLGPESATIDLDTPVLDLAALRRVEEAANWIIAEDRPVRIRTVERGEAEALLASGALRKLPERGGPMRLIDIDNCDLNACGGTHVRSTGQIGGLLLRGVERVRGGLRLGFVCGLRAARSAASDFAVLEKLSGQLSAASAELPPAVARLQAEAKELRKQVRAAQDELADREAQSLAAAHAGPFVVAQVLEGRGVDFARRVASRLSAQAPGCVAAFGVTEDGRGRVVMARGAEVELHCGQRLRAALASVGGRGGGSPTMAEGECPIDQVPAVLAAAVS
ncbi:MAG TPA: DHHA1 domain-containing protein [Terriglobales bacterium]|nr:DHHA1 domain-containing protein [Terriglobales bacterium]